MTISRDFKGIWIPKDLWVDKRLTYFEKLLAAEIDSLDGQDHCYASNEYFCEFFDCKERQIQDGISKLKKLGIIAQIRFDGRTRWLKSNLKTVYEIFSTSDPQEAMSKQNLAPQTSGFPHLSSIEKPIERDNKDYNKAEESSSSSSPPSLRITKEEMRKRFACSDDGFEEAWRRYEDSPPGHVKVLQKWLETVIPEIEREMASEKDKEDLAIKHERQARANSIFDASYQIQACRNYVEFSSGSHCRQVPYDCSDAEWKEKTGWE
jgi:hypothetical protein